VEFVDLDTDCFWLWCGSECDGAFIGPHPSAEAAERDRNASGCDHDHIVFRLTLRQMASKLPGDAFRFCSGFAIGATSKKPGRTILRTPCYPHSSVEFADAAIQTMQLQLTGALP
jgi:hypothetical protein